MKNKQLKRTVVLVAVCHALAPEAFSQGGAGVLEEVMVTAQKRTQNAQDVPIAISSLSEQFISDTGIDNLTQALPLLPGVTGSTYGIGTNAWAIRGITSNDWSIGSEPSVAVYIDEAYVGRNVLATAAFFDLASLEALKGPQGTLFGRNASAGALTLQTNKPSDESTLEVGVGFGNEEQYDFDLVGNLAVSQAFALRLAYHGTRFEGMWRDIANDEEMYRDEDAVRLSARWDVSDTFQAVLTLSYGEQESNGSAAYSPSISTVEPGEEYPDRLAYDTRNRESNDTNGASLRLQWDLSESMTLTSITDFRNGEYKYLADVDGASNGAAIDTVFGGVTGSVSLDFEQADTDVETFGQELRLSGSRGSIDWFVGVNYYQEDLSENQSLVLRNTLDASELGLPVGLELARDRNDISGDNTSIGAYGDFSWSASEKLRLTAGMRYTWDEKEFCSAGLAQIGFIATNTPDQICDTQDWDEFTPRLVVDYSIADTSMMYASVSRGYKAGGYNPAAVATNAQGLGDQVAAFQPEQNLSYEVGVKSEFMDKRLRLNAAAFLSDYEDIQVQTATAGGIIIGNAAKTSISGVELELTYAASEALTLAANYAHVSGDYEDDGVYDGNQLIFAPENSAAVNARYTIPTSYGEWSAFALYSWQSEMFYSPVNTEALREPSYGLLSARLGFVPNSGSWELALSGENLLDEEYGVHRQDIGIGVGAALSRGLPRLYKVIFNYMF